MSRCFFEENKFLELTPLRRAQKETDTGQPAFCAPSERGLGSLLRFVRRTNDPGWIAPDGIIRRPQSGGRTEGNAGRFVDTKRRGMRYANRATRPDEFAHLVQQFSQESHSGSPPLLWNGEVGFKGATGGLSQDCQSGSLLLFCLVLHP